MSDGDGSAFFVTAYASDEACAGFDARALAAALIQRGCLEKPERKIHPSAKVRTPGHGRPR